MKDKYLDADYQNSVREFVQREVIYCVSHLISNLAEYGDNDTYYDEILSVLVKDDFEQTCLDNDWEFLDIKEITVLYNNKLQLIYNAWSEETEEFEKYEGLHNFITNAEYVNDYDIKTNSDIDWQAIADDCSYDPHQTEAYEHWIVSKWLAEKLEAKGEMVACDIHGLVVWGRATTGQAILLDRVICDIYDEMVAV